MGNDDVDYDDENHRSSNFAGPSAAAVVDAASATLLVVASKERTRQAMPLPLRLLLLLLIVMMVRIRIHISLEIGLGPDPPQQPHTIQNRATDLSTFSSFAVCCPHLSSSPKTPALLQRTKMFACTAAKLYACFDCLQRFSRCVSIAWIHPRISITFSRTKRKKHAPWMGSWSNPCVCIVNISPRKKKKHNVSDNQ